MVDDDDPALHWVGPGVPTKGRTRYTYRTVKMRCKYKGRLLERYFNYGDTVYMWGEENEVWFAQILKFYEPKLPPYDPEVQIVGDVPKQKNKWVCFRWFINPSDVDGAIKWEDSDDRPSAPRPKENELYFSDHVEVKLQSNLVSAILGRAYLCDQIKKMEAFPNSRYIASDNPFSSHVL